MSGNERERRRKEEKTRKEGVTTIWTRLKMSQGERERERVKEWKRRERGKEQEERTKYLEVYPRRFFPPLLLFQS